jgi:hypothetical protein
MKNTNKWQFLVIVAAALSAAACDPFPAAPSGDPAVVRVTTYDGSVSSTVERSGGAAGTVSTDLATPFSTIFIQFNKPMDGSSIQDPADYGKGILYFDPTATPPTSGCVAASGLSLGGAFSTNTLETAVCNYSSSATDGGQIAIYSLNLMVLGETYTVSGTVRDYEGKSLPINVTVQVDDTPFATPSSNGYTNIVQWWERAAPGAYTLDTAPDVSGAPGTWAPVVGAPTCDGVECTYNHIALNPLSKHWYRLTEVGQTRRQIGSAVQGTSLGRAVTLANVAVAGVVQPGQLRATWSTVTGATGFVLERSLNPDATPAVWTTVYTAVTNTTGSRNFVDTLLTSGTTYYYRVTPTYTPAVTGLSPGPVASRVAP